MRPSEALEKVPWIRGNMYSEVCQCHPESDMSFKSLNCTNGVCMLGAIHLTIRDSDNRLNFAVAIGKVMEWPVEKIEAPQIEQRIMTYNDIRCPDKDKALDVLRDAEYAFEAQVGFDFEYRDVPDDYQGLYLPD